MKLPPSSFEDILVRDGKLIYTNVGTSMMPLLRQRQDILVITAKTEERLHLWDVPLFRRSNGQYVMHRVIWVGKDGYVMCGDNQWRPEFGVKEGQILGILEGVVRREADGSSHLLPVRPSAEHPRVPLRYRLYVFIWCFFYPIRALILMCKQSGPRVLGRIIRKIRS